MKESLLLAQHIPIEEKIRVIRDQRVMLDVDLAELYGISTGQLNQQVTRNKDRFPEDFMFQLSKEEKKDITNCDILRNVKYSRVLPKAFTEHGAIMLANILRSKRAVQMSIHVVRAFAKLRREISIYTDLARKISELEHRISTNDEAIRSIFSAIHNLMSPTGTDEKKIGFKLSKKE